MLPPSRPVRVDELRDAARRAVEVSSLRQVAREIGLSAPGLSSFLEGASPRRGTVRKLQAWYVRRSTAGTDVSEETARAALDLLVDSLTERKRGKVQRMILDVLGEAHRRGGTEPPPWLDVLREDEPPGRPPGSEEDGERGRKK